MQNKNNVPISTGSARRHLSGTPVLLGFAGSLALLAGLSLLRNRPRARRYADHAQDRRNPMSLFIPAGDARRREIDLSGAHPLFERRQSVYDAY